MDILDTLKENYKRMEEATKRVDSVRSLFSESNTNPLSSALSDVVKVLKGTSYTLIGGLALGQYIKPRGTDDVDILLASEQELNKVHQLLQSSDLFKRLRDHSSIHKSTQVEVELLTPEFLKISSQVTSYAIDTCKKVEFHGNVLSVATAKALVILKLQRFSKQDQADIENLIKSGVTDISDVVTNEVTLAKFNKLKNEAASNEL